MSCEKFISGDCPGQEPGQQKLETAPPTGGDMLKSVYDSDNDGRVDSAATADTAGHADSADEATEITGVSAAGVSHYYGTDESGTPGFWTIPGASAPTYTLHDLTDVDTPAPQNGQVLTFNSTTMQWEAVTPPGAGGGEANTATNVGAGEGLFVNKVGVELQFKSLVAEGADVSSDPSEIFIVIDDTLTWIGV